MDSGWDRLGKWLVHMGLIPSFSSVRILIIFKRTTVSRIEFHVPRDCYLVWLMSDEMTHVTVRCQMSDDGRSENQLLR